MNKRKKYSILIECRKNVMNDTEISNQMKNLTQFIAQIESTPELRADVSNCTSNDELVAIAEKLSIYITSNLLTRVQDDLAAGYWPWVQTRRII